MSVDLMASAMGRKRDCASSEARYHRRFDIDAQVSDNPRACTSVLGIVISNIKGASTVEARDIIQIRYQQA